MNAACPDPHKTARFATQKAAEARQARAELRLGTPLYPYPCICGWWHYTSNPHANLPSTAKAHPNDIHRLLHLTATDFTNLVAAEVKGEIPTPDRIALRHPHLRTRWRRTLKTLHTDINRNLTNRATHTDAFTTEWRPRAQRYRDTLALRLTEAQRINTPQPQAA
ncbi:hypothetical protein [Streptomyces sp. NPDC005548]|uniref:hypothetical protein n=1 Tax=Streptomyces sp. NPDC005548 TaxID=3364724 RepID=UPI00368D614E